MATPQPPQPGSARPKDQRDGLTNQPGHNIDSASQHQSARENDKDDYKRHGMRQQHADRLSAATGRRVALMPGSHTGSKPGLATPSRSPTGQPEGPDERYAAHQGKGQQGAAPIIRWLQGEGRSGAHDESGLSAYAVPIDANG